MLHINQYVQALLLKIKLHFSRQRLIAFDLPSFGELQFIGPVLLEYANRNPHKSFVVIHNANVTARDFILHFPRLRNKMYHIHRNILNHISLPNIRVFITSEQYDLGLDGVYSISMFHGQAAKGLSFVPEVISTFDALFLNGPMHKEAFELFVSDFLDGVYPENLDLFEIGYPKSDKLLNGKFFNDEFLEFSNLDSNKKIILYAPAFNEGASLREFGLEIIEFLGNLTQYNIIVKLPIDCWEPTDNFYATGGINWFEKISELEARFPSIRLYSEFEIDPILARADILITCISSVGFEFMALNKPVIFIDTPRYFNDYLKNKFPNHDTTSWANRSTVNGGKEFGLVITRVEQLKHAIETVLLKPESYPLHKERLKSYLLYNPGRAAEAAVNKLEELMGLPLKSKRPYERRSLMTFLLKKTSYKIAQARTLILSYIKRRLVGIFNSYGYMLEKSSQGYIDSEKTVNDAKSINLTLCEYLEKRDNDPRKIGRRDRIIDRLEHFGILNDGIAVCEIGAGTGMYMEKTIAKVSVSQYEIYEVNLGWKEYLKREFRGKVRSLTVHDANGINLNKTQSDSVDLVHAHGVFVYLPIINVSNYLRECVRTCRSGGYIVFDVISDLQFTFDTAKSWSDLNYSFPVIIPSSFISDFSIKMNLELINRFEEIYGGSHSTYYILRKK